MNPNIQPISPLQINPQINPYDSNSNPPPKPQLTKFDKLVKQH
jgi:hypothetical protein